MFKPIGIQASIITPFDKEGNLMENAFREHLDWMVRAGVHGIGVGANTGEFISMTFDELKQATLIAMDEVKGRVPITIGAINPGMRENLEIVKWAKSVGVDAVLIQAPYYLAPPLGEDVYDYFKLIGSVGLPMVIFNHIHKTKYNLMPKDYEKLFSIDTFVSVKETDPSMENNTLRLECLQANGRTYLMAEDYNNFTHYLLGGEGTFSAIVNVAPELAVSLYNHCKAGNIKEALEEHRKIVHLCSILDGANYPAGIKAAMELTGHNGGVTRKPIGCAPDNVMSNIRKELKYLNMI